MDAELKKLADSIAGRLLAEGFTVHRYDAHSTNSVYLKLDYGVCNSIRISDHPGKRYLKYRYNIGPFVKEFKEVKDKYPRLYYRADKSDRMIKRIVQDRDAKRFRYGESGYEGLMRKNRSAYAGSRGFWSKPFCWRGRGPQKKRPDRWGAKVRANNKIRKFSISRKWRNVKWIKWIRRSKRLKAIAISSLIAKMAAASMTLKRACARFRIPSRPRNGKFKAKTNVKNFRRNAWE